MLINLPASTTVIDSQIESGAAARLNHALRLTDMDVCCFHRLHKGLLDMLGQGFTVQGARAVFGPSFLQPSKYMFSCFVYCPEYRHMLGGPLQGYDAWKQAGSSSVANNRAVNRTLTLCNAPVLMHDYCPQKAAGACRWAVMTFLISWHANHMLPQSIF